MRNTFRYSLTADDYLNYEKFAVKLRKSNVVSVVMIMILVAITVYYGVRNGGLEVQYYIYFVAFVVTVAMFTLFTNIIVPKKKVNRYIKSDASYLGENEITIDDKAIEIKNIPAEKETGVVCVYPYSVISIIYETENYFYFIVANEVKILPKRVIPQAMSQSVFNAINRNPNRMYVK